MLDSSYKFNRCFMTVSFVNAPISRDQQHYLALSYIVLKMVKHTKKILWCKHHNIFEACLTVSLRYSWNGCKKTFEDFSELFRSWTCRNSHRRCSIKKCVIKNFATFTGKHLCKSFFFIKASKTGILWILRKF